MSLLGLARAWVFREAEDRFLQSAARFENIVPRIYKNSPALKTRLPFGGSGGRQALQE
jgi:hypothetical protein